MISQISVKVGGKRGPSRDAIALEISRLLASLGCNVAIVGQTKAESQLLTQKLKEPIDRIDHLSLDVIVRVQGGSFNK